jgi:ribosomal protein S18 acetylase RimI-like enzyme
MTYNLRRFSGEPDKEAMGRLARASASENLHVTDLPYRFSSWALNDPENVGLWVDVRGELAGWAVLQAPFWTIDYALNPESDLALHRQILAWADNRARQVLGTQYGPPAWFVNVFADQTDRLRELEAAGFTSQVDRGEDSWSKVWMLRPAARPVVQCVPPAGFSMRPLAGEAEVEAYVRLHRTVFGTKNMTEDWRWRTLRQPEYVPDLDLVAVAPDGGLAAFCVAWLDADAHGGPTAQIEPMGVHPGWRGLGLGQAILSEALQRLQVRGARQIGVETDEYRSTALALYRSVGFRKARSVCVLGKGLTADAPPGP